MKNFLLKRHHVSGVCGYQTKTREKITKTCKRGFKCKWVAFLQYDSSHRQTSGAPASPAIGISREWLWISAWAEMRLQLTIAKALCVCSLPHYHCFQDMLNIISERFYIWVSSKSWIMAERKTVWAPLWDCTLCLLFLMNGHCLWEDATSCEGLEFEVLQMSTAKGLVEGSAIHPVKNQGASTLATALVKPWVTRREFLPTPFSSWFSCSAIKQITSSLLRVSFFLWSGQDRPKWNRWAPNPGDGCDYSWCITGQVTHMQSGKREKDAALLEGVFHVGRLRCKPLGCVAGLFLEIHLSARAAGEKHLPTATGGAAWLGVERFLGAHSGKKNQEKWGCCWKGAKGLPGRWLQAQAFISPLWGWAPAAPDGDTPHPVPLTPHWGRPPGTKLGFFWGLLAGRGRRGWGTAMETAARIPR